MADIKPIIRTDAYVRHEMDIQRFALTTSNKFRNENFSLIENQYKQVLADTKNVTTKRQAKALADRLSSETSSVLGKEVKSLSVDLETFAGVESNWNKSTLSVVMGQTAKLAAPDLILTAASKHVMQGGQSVGEFFGSVVKTNRVLARKAVMEGWKDGLTNSQIAKMLIGSSDFDFRDGQLQTIKRNVEAAIRTQINAIGDTARLQTFKANSDIVKKEMILATLDYRTSLICQFYDRQIFNLGTGPRPPFHPNCRSLTVPLFKGETADDIVGKRPAITSGKNYKKGDKFTRTGRVRKPRAGDDRFKIIQTRASETDFGKFLHRQNAAFQSDVLGARKAAIFRKYDLDIEDMVKTTKAGYYQRPLTLKELERRVEHGAFNLKPLRSVADKSEDATDALFNKFQTLYAKAPKSGTKVFKFEGKVVQVHRSPTKTLIFEIDKRRFFDPDDAFDYLTKTGRYENITGAKVAKGVAKKATAGEWTKQNLKAYQDLKALAISKAKAAGGNASLSKVINGRPITIQIRNNKVYRLLDGKPVPASKIMTSLKNFKASGAKPTTPIPKPKPKPIPKTKPAPAPGTAAGTWTKQDLSRYTDFKNKSTAKAKANGGSGTFETTINGREIKLEFKNNRLTRYLNGEQIPVSKYRSALRDATKGATATVKPAKGIKSFSFVDNANVSDPFSVLKNLPNNAQARLMEKFMNRSDLNTIFVNKEVMSGNTRLVSKAKVDQLRKETKLGMHVITDSTNPNGFTHIAYNHVVVRLNNPRTDFTKVNIRDLTGGVKRALSRHRLPYERNGKYFSFTQATTAEELAHGTRMLNTQPMTTLIHEVGHQVHFWARAEAGDIFKFMQSNGKYKSLTHYGSELWYEWHAEHFVAWVLDREALAKWDADIAKYFDKLMSKALKSKTKTFRSQTYSVTPKR